MSNPSEVSEKVVWLENNMPLWFLLCAVDNDRDDVQDVVSTVLAHISPRGVDELYSLMVELVEADEMFKKIPMKGWTPKDLEKLKEATISDPPWNLERGNMDDGEYISISHPSPDEVRLNKLRQPNPEKEGTNDK